MVNHFMYAKIGQRLSFDNSGDTYSISFTLLPNSGLVSCTTTIMDQRWIRIAMFILDDVRVILGIVGTTMSIDSVSTTGRINVIIGSMYYVKMECKRVRICSSSSARKGIKMMPILITISIERAVAAYSYLLVLVVYLL